MKFLLLALLAVPSFAQDTAETGAMFQQAKAHLISNLDARMTNLNNAKSCVNNAADGAALKVCREELNKANRALKDTMKTQREGMRIKRNELRAKKRAEKTK